MYTRIPGYSAQASLRRATGTYRAASPGTAAEVFTSAQMGSFVPLGPSTHSVGPPLVADASVPPVAASFPSIPVYGNWCGPGFSGPGSPIDEVDQACCRHDECFGENGFDDCKCNRDLIARLPVAAANPNVPASGKVAAAGIVAALQLAPCICHKACVPFLGCHDIPGGLGVPGVPGLHLCPPGFA
jgi:hypothetical protein